MRRHSLIFCCLLAGISSSLGCKTDDLDISNGKAMRARAAATDVKLGGYIADQRTRIQTLNHRFRDSYARTSNQLAHVFEDELEQQQDLDYVHFADSLLLDWQHRAVRSSLYDLLVSRPQELQSRIDASDKELSDARDAYADGYKELNDNLDKLETARRDVRALTEYHPEQSLASLLKAVATTYQELQKERRDKEKKATESANGKCPASKELRCPRITTKNWQNWSSAAKQSLKGRSLC